MNLSNLKPAEGAIKHSKRIGRGAGSGKGGTATRGNKGAKSRSGYHQKIGFEGGQMPIYRRLPKFGFKNINRIEYVGINIDVLNNLAETKNITDFNVVAWLRQEMRMMLDEEKARAILIGDDRNSDDEAYIRPDHIRPIATDSYLFTVKVPVEVAHNATGATKAKKFIDSVIRSRKLYKGSGDPSLYTTEDMLTECLLLEDNIGHKLYKTVAELATTLRVNEIVTVEPMEGHTITFQTEDEVTVANKPLLGIIVNLDDYRVGADKGGEINTFEDFDIDYNQHKYLIETRCSGAMVKPFGALSIYLDEASA